MGSFIDALFLAFFVFTHGDLDQRILEKSNQIALFPQDHQLYMERGELYLLHEEYQNASVDFFFCLKNGLENTRVFTGMSKALLNLHSLDSALIFAEKTLALENEHLSALDLKGKILSALGRHCEAASTFEQLLSLSAHPSPVLFLATSEDWILCEDSDGPANAVRILKEGINRAGPVLVLQKKLVSLYTRQNQLSEAIRVQTSIIEQSNLKIRSYLERAQLYMEMQSPDKAKADLTEALLLWNQLPEHKKSLSSIKIIGNNIVELLNELEN